MEQTKLQPRLEDLTASFLARRQTDHHVGLPTVESAEVEPYESVPAQSVDPRLALEASLESLEGAGAKPTIAIKAPTGWACVVAGLEPVCAMPIAMGCFPQAVRDLLPMIRSDRLSKTKSTPRVNYDDPGLNNWIESAVASAEPEKWLFAVAMLRITGRTKEAAAVLELKGNAAPANWRPAFANEEATLAWFAGDSASAIARWTAMPESAVRSFNLGMAELFNDRHEAACVHLKSAIATLDENSSWHHLAKLYLALAESR